MHKVKSSAVKTLEPYYKIDFFFVKVSEHHK